MEEYTPMRDRNLGGGKANLYGRLLVEELKPWVDRNYRTLDGACTYRRGRFVAGRTAIALSRPDLAAGLRTVGGAFAVGVVGARRDAASMCAARGRNRDRVSGWMWVLAKDR